MIVATILLDQNGCYVDAESNLPGGRPDWDKALLTALCRDQIISKEAVGMLPASICRVAKWDDSVEPECPITIKEINGLTDLLIVTRSNIAVINGKVFRLDNFELIVAQGQLEIWRRK